MSIKIMTRVWESNIGPASRRLVLLALADSANDEGMCWPSIGTLARKAGIGRTTTEDAVRSLEADGLLVRNRRFNDSNVYQLVWENLVPIASPEIRGAPEIEGSPPPNPGGAPPEIPGTNRKRTQSKNLKTSAANASGDQIPLLPGLEPPAPDEPAEKELTVNQRAVILAQRHYERLGKMGNVPAWGKIIRKALEGGARHGLDPADVDARVDIALQYIADRNWSLTEERLATTLRGGPKPAGQIPPPLNGQRKTYLRGPNGKRGMELQVD